MARNKKIYLISILIVFFIILLMFLPRPCLYNLEGRSVLAFYCPTSSFYDDFNSDRTLEEAAFSNESKSLYWWVNSGVYFIKGGGVGKTVQGELPLGHKWQIEYANSNPVDTGNGTHPQNIFRLVTRTKWENLKQEVYFKIVRYYLSSSENRDEPNGVLLFNRYQDADNLYYTGLRVDGAAVVKKKISGTYYTMAYKKIFSGTYNRDTNPSLLPKNTWVGLRSEVVNNENGSVSISLFVDKEGNGEWEEVLGAIDDGEGFGGESIKEGGFGGIRTDFMDVQFEDYSIRNL